jgi:hypothetical protein
MTEEQGGEAAATETTDAAPEAAVLSEDTQEEVQTEDTRDYEADAAGMGWRPQEEWTGKPEHWKDAKTYVEHGDHISRIADARVAKVEKDFTDRFAKLEKVNAKTVQQLQAQHAKEVAELKAAKREAVKAGDVDEVDRLDQQIEDMRDDDAPKEMTQEEQNKHNQSVQTKWTRSHDWWGVDKKMTRFAIGTSQDLAADNPDMSIEDNLEMVLDELKKEFPEKFGGKKKPSANGHALVDGGGAFPGAQKNKDDAFSKLPAEAKAQAQKDVAAKLYPDVNAWAEVYNS